MMKQTPQEVHFLSSQGVAAWGLSCAVSGHTWGRWAAAPPALCRRPACWGLWVPHTQLAWGDWQVRCLWWRAGLWEDRQCVLGHTHTSPLWAFLVGPRQGWGGSLGPPTTACSPLMSWVSINDTTMMITMTYFAPGTSFYMPGLIRHFMHHHPLWFSRQPKK